MLNDKVDMSNIVALTITGSESRFPFLVATVTNVLSRVKNLDWNVLIDYEYEGYDFDKNRFTDETKNQIWLALVHMGKLNNNKIAKGFVRGSTNKSIAWQKAAWIEKFYHQMEQNYLLNIDDDMIYETEAFESLTYAINEDPVNSLFITTQFDVYNKRQHKDYDTITRKLSGENVELFSRQIGQRFIAHHLWTQNNIHWAEDSVFVMAMSSSWCAKMSELIDKGITKKMREFNRGERGYDIMIALELGGAKFVIPSMAYHIGLLDEYYNNKWKGHNNKYLERWENGK